jgi:leucyl-tRNA synthetase
MRITAYAERLLEDLESLDWSESIKLMQRNWIGKSEGAEVDFKLAIGPDTIRVYTTRPDTLFGATYIVLAPEHPLVERITTPGQREEVQNYRDATSRKSDFERTELAKTKTGVFTGAYAVNPAGGKHIPVWIADYVLSGYGTGAIMAVPGHDERDWEFAKQFGLPIDIVVRPPDEWLKKTGNQPDVINEPFVDEGTAMCSGFLDGLPTTEAKQKMIDWLEKNSIGVRKVNYKLRDWLFSRQRYWGEPFPVLHGPAGEVVPVAELPVTLPDLADYKPTGSPDGPLAKSTDWVNVSRDGKLYKRETNTMPQWAGSCWYYLRYIDPTNAAAFAEKRKLDYWLPVDLYVGGAEHAVLHLLYARFWHKVLFDRGYVSCPEPFQKLVNQGMILGEYEYHIMTDAYAANQTKLADLGVTAVFRKSEDERKPDTYVLKTKAAGGDQLVTLPDDLVEKVKGKTLLKGTGVELTAKAEKMSKSRGNVVNPDDIISEYGADSLRLYEMFMGPLEAVKPWDTKSIRGVYGFLARAWRLVVDDGETMKLHPAVTDAEPDNETLRLLHRTIKKVTDDTEGMRFNTAIAAMMEFVNHLTGQPARPRAVLEPFVLLLAPYAPHIAEELWAALGHPTTLAYEPWPAYDPALTKADEIEVPVQVNGKLKARLRVPAEIDDQALEAAARADQAVTAAIAGKAVKKVIVVPRKLVNLVVG